MSGSELPAWIVFLEAHRKEWDARKGGEENGVKIPA